MPRKKPAPPKPTGPALSTIEATLKHTPLVVQTLVRLQLATGLTASQVLDIRSTDLDRKTEPWQLRISTEQTIELSPGATELLRPHANRVGYILSPHKSGIAFSLEAYSNAIRYGAVEKAHVHRWSPLDLCHTRENLLDQLTAKVEFTADGNCTATKSH